MLRYILALAFAAAMFAAAQAEAREQITPPQSLVNPYVRPVELDDYFPAVRAWIEASPGRDYYFAILPRCDVAGWTVFGHNAVDPQAGDLFMPHVQSNEQVWETLNEEWGNHDWGGEGPEMLITAPEGLCVLLPQALRI
jgi:hypothetical protein